MSKRNVKEAKKRTVDPYQQEKQKYSELSNRKMALLGDKKDWEMKLQELKKISECIMHNDMLCPNGKSKHLEHCQTSRLDKSHLPDNKRTHREPSPALQISNSIVDHKFQKIYTTLNEHASATRRNCTQGRETSDSHVSPAGYNVSQQQTFCAVRETCRQPGAPDDCQTLHLLHSPANSSSSTGRRAFAVPANNLKVVVHVFEVPAPINQAIHVSARSVVVPDCSSQINHTQEHVLNYLQGTRSDYPMFPESSLDDVLDTIEMDSQSLKSSLQGQENLHSSNAVSHVGSSSSQSEIDHSRSLNRKWKKIRVVEYQACLKLHVSKSKTKINGNAEDDDVDKSQSKLEVNVADSVTVVREMIECLTIDDMKT